MPAAAAGEPASTVPIVLSRRSTPTNRLTATTTTGSSRFMPGPANRMISFFQSGCAARESGGGVDVTESLASSSMASPSIFTKPPSGNQAST